MQPTFIKRINTRSASLCLHIVAAKRFRCGNHGAETMNHVETKASIVVTFAVFARNIRKQSDDIIVVIANIAPRSVKIVIIDRQENVVEGPIQF